MSESSARRFYTIIYPEHGKKSEKVEMKTDTVNAETINEIVGAPYELIPTKCKQYVIAEHGAILMGSRGDADHLPFNKKATNKTDGSMCYQVSGTAVYIRMKYLEYVAGDKRGRMDEFLAEHYPNGSRRTK